MAPSVQFAVPYRTIDSPIYSQVGFAQSSNGLACIAGQIGVMKDGSAPPDYVSQVHLAFFNLRKTLASVGGDIKDIAKLTIYIVAYDPKRRLHVLPMMNFLAGHKPAMTLVPVEKLAQTMFLFEVEAFASIAPKLTAQPPSLHAIKSVDVVVVGGGLSGLQAASDVVKSGLSCTVLEARDRVGGKTWSKKSQSGKGVSDVGAAWINDTNQSHMFALARQFGLETIVQNTTGDCVFHSKTGETHSFPYGELPFFSESEREDCARIRDLVEEVCHTLDNFEPQNSHLDSLTFEAYVREQKGLPMSQAVAGVWTRAMLGVEPSEISALFFIHYCRSGGGLLQMRSDRKHGGQYLRIRSGTQSFALGMAASLPARTVKLSTAVTGIVQGVDGSANVAVSTDANEVILARKVIVSVPTPVYKTIQFSPPLAVGKNLLTDSSRYGFYMKSMVIFKRPFWVEHGFCGLVQSIAGPASIIRDTSSPADDYHVLTCFMVGPEGKAWYAHSDDERRGLLLEQIATVFADKEAVEKEFVEITEYNWGEDPWSGWGCPCASTAPGVIDTVGDALRTSHGDVHFVGTETAGEWKGYMEGAIRSGIRGGSEVVAALTQVKAKL